MPRPRRARIYTFLLAALPLACTLRPPPGGSGDTGETDSAGTTTSDAPTSSAPTSSATDVASEPTTGPGNTVEACGFAGCETTLASTSAPGTTGDATTGDIPDSCPGFKQLDPDCPDGFKCTIDGSIGATQCAPIVPRPKQLSEPCTVTGTAQSGIDDCDLGLLCWDADDQGHGTCIGLCNEDNGEFTCQDPSAVCTGLTCQSCAVSLCLVPCNPLLHECGPGQTCTPDNTTFICAPDASGDQGVIHDACEFINSCDDGLFCINISEAPADCDAKATGCCEPFCDLDQPKCPSPEQTCAPWFADPPPDFKDLGVCIVP